MKIKVLVIDDSSVIRDILSAIINEQPDMMVVGAAPDPLVARDMIRQFNPDVLTLDIEMPHMNGLSFLKRLMTVRPMPVVMVSSHTREGSDIAFRALALGAVDFISKPQLGQGSVENYARQIAETIRGAHAARDNLPRIDPSRVPDAAVVLPDLANDAVGQSSIIVIGASTGGAEALREILAAIPADCPPVFVALQMPEAFTRHFAQRLEELCRAKVKVPEHGEPALPGHVYLAPGDAQITVQRYGTRGFGVQLEPSADGSSADPLFASAASAAGRDAIGVILTGRGDDGAAGLLEMRNAGGYTIAQDEATSIVFGMPRAAIEAGAACDVAALGQIAKLVLGHLAAVAQQAPDLSFITHTTATGDTSISVVTNPLGGVTNE